jgi:hypothetical protein
MNERQHDHLYDETPAWARAVGWLLMGIGGFVLAPIALFSRAWWLLAAAAPFALAGLLLLQLHLRIEPDRLSGGLVCTNSFLGLRLRRQRYDQGEIEGFDLQKVGSDERQRPSDTWYLRLLLRQRTHIIGAYETHEEALKAQYRQRQRLNIAAPGEPDVERSS